MLAESNFNPLVFDKRSSNEKFLRRRALFDEASDSVTESLLCCFGGIVQRFCGW